MQSCLLRISNPPERLTVFDDDHKILGDRRYGITDAVSDFEPLGVRVGVPITIGSASACAGSYSYCCHKRLSFVTVEMQLLQGYGSLPNHTPQESWAAFRPPPQVSQVGAIPFTANTRLIWAKRLSKGGVFSKPTTIVCISFITFLYSYLKARRLSFVWKVPMHCIRKLSRKKTALSR